MLQLNKTQNLHNINPLEFLNNSFPDFISLYNVAGISRETKILPFKKLENQDQLINIYQITGSLNGIVSTFSKTDLKFKHELISEATNIIIGHLIGSMSSKGIDFKISAPQTLKRHEQEFIYNFSIKYCIENSIIKDFIYFNFSFNYGL